MDVIIVCHTEFGYVLHTRRSRPCIFEKSATIGVEEGVTRLAKIADTLGAKVTFAVMPETVRNFPDVGHEIGLHVHPGWTVSQNAGISYNLGDGWLWAHCTQSTDSPHLPDHPFDEQLALINAGKDHLRDCLGTQPTVFVAGRWAVDNNTVEALVKSGFSHECSAVAHAKTDHFDWSKLPRKCMPYHPHLDDYQRSGSLPLLMVPISQMLAIGLVTPENVPRCGISWLKACFTDYYVQKLPVFHVCLHSPCMTDPLFVRALTELLQFIRRHDVEFKYASEVEYYGARRAQTKLAPYVAGINTTLLRNAPREMWKYAARWYNAHAEKR